MSKSILIVEDFPETLQMLKTIMEQEGYEVVTAETGETALEVLSTRRIDLVLLDIMLPRVDGFEVNRRIKQDPRTRKVPVIALTAFDVPEIVSKCMTAGADDVILKPFQIDNLLKTVRKYV
jgi:two-component system cell cycle response regulator